MTSSGPSTRCVCTQLRAASRAVARRYECELAHAGLTASQFAVLRALERAGTLPLSRLAEELVMERTTLYRALRPLLRDDLVLLRDTRDRRVKEAEMTAAGRRRLAAGLPHWQRAQEAFLADFGAGDWPAFEAALARAVATAAGPLPRGGR
jgi:DNA-binding MarR family transcriptional regulator